MGKAIIRCPQSQLCSLTFILLKFLSPACCTSCFQKNLSQLSPFILFIYNACSSAWAGCFMLWGLQISCRSYPVVTSLEIFYPRSPEPFIVLLMDQIIPTFCPSVIDSCYSGRGSFTAKLTARVDMTRLSGHYDSWLNTCANTSGAEWRPHIHTFPQDSFAVS